MLGRYQCYQRRIATPTRKALMSLVVRSHARAHLCSSLCSGSAALNDVFELLSRKTRIHQIQEPCNKRRQMPRSRACPAKPRLYVILTTSCLQKEQEGNYESESGYVKHGASQISSAENIT